MADSGGSGGAAPGGGAALGGSTALPGDNSFQADRYVTPASLISTFNPRRIAAFGGTEAAGIGADPAITGPCYVFFTRPDLNLGIGGDTSDPQAKTLAQRILGVGNTMADTPLAQLLVGGSGFIPLLTNMCKGYSPQDVVLDVTQVGEGWDGARLPVGKSTLNSRQDGTVEFEFEEWGGAPVTLLAKIWTDYIDSVAKGLMYPRSSSSGVNYLKMRVLDYACSIYAFQTLPDCCTIQWGARWTGCFPTAQPHSAWGGQVPVQHSPVTVRIPFAYSYYEPMENAIFNEFNLASNQTAGQSGALVSAFNAAESLSVANLFGGGTPQGASGPSSGVKITSTSPYGSSNSGRKGYWLLFDTTASQLGVPGF